MNFSEHELTIQRLSDRISELENELSKDRNMEMEKLSMEAYHKGDFQLLYDVLDDFIDKLKPIPKHVIKVLCEAYYEMNTIRARDGVPIGSQVTQEYWDSIIDRLDKIVLDETGHTAHCHPSLYKEL